MSKQPQQGFCLIPVRTRLLPGAPARFCLRSLCGDAWWQELLQGPLEMGGRLLDTNSYLTSGWDCRQPILSDVQILQTCRSRCPPLALYKVGIALLCFWLLAPLCSLWSCHSALPTRCLDPEPSATVKKNEKENSVAFLHPQSWAREGSGVPQNQAGYSLFPQSTVGV